MRGGDEINGLETTCDIIALVLSWEENSRHLGSRESITRQENKQKTKILERILRTRRHSYILPS